MTIKAPDTRCCCRCFLRRLMTAANCCTQCMLRARPSDHPVAPPTQPSRAPPVAPPCRAPLRFDVPPSIAIGVQPYIRGPCALEHNGRPAKALVEACSRRHSESPPRARGESSAVFCATESVSRMLAAKSCPGISQNHLARTVAAKADAPRRLQVIGVPTMKDRGGEDDGRDGWWWRRSWWWWWQR